MIPLLQTETADSAHSGTGNIGSVTRPFSQFLGRAWGRGTCRYLSLMVSPTLLWFCRQACTYMYTGKLLWLTCSHLVSMFRGELILMIMLCCTAHEMSHLCSKMCLNV